MFRSSSSHLKYFLMVELLIKWREQNCLAIVNQQLINILVQKQTKNKQGKLTLFAKFTYGRFSHKFIRAGRVVKDTWNQLALRFRAFYFGFVKLSPGLPTSSLM